MVFTATTRIERLGPLIREAAADAITSLMNTQSGDRHREAAATVAVTEAVVTS